MEKEDLNLDKSLQKLNILFTLTGINLPNKIKTTSYRIRQRWYFFFNFLSSVVVVSLASYYVFISIVNKKNIIEVTSLLPCMSITVLGIFKTFNHIMKEGKLFNLIEILRNLERDENQREASVERRKIVNEDKTFLNQVINASYVNLGLMIIVFNTMPLVMMGLKYYRTQELRLMLQYLDIFAYTPQKMLYWILSYIHQFWAAYVVLLELGAVDNLLFTCCLYIRIQFRLLHHDIEMMIPEDDEVMPHEEFQSKFSALVIRHQTIIETTEILEEIYSSSNLINFMSSSLVICLTGFTLSVEHSFEVVLKYVAFFIMGLMQVFFMCWFADMMTTASTDISNAVYNSRWYRCHVSGRKALLLMQTRAQRPCALSAAGFAEVDLNAFLRVMSTSWSYFALLQTVYGASE